MDVGVGSVTVVILVSNIVKAVVPEFLFSQPIFPHIYATTLCVIVSATDSDPLE